MSSKTYNASCHCGQIKYTVTLPSAISPEGETKINRCNCSICTANGYILVYPKREDVVFLDDSESKLKDYYMGLKLKAHRFCPHCSSSVLIDFQHGFPERARGYLATNVRLFEGVDLDNAEYMFFDGKNWDGKSAPEKTPLTKGKESS